MPSDEQVGQLSSDQKDIEALYVEVHRSLDFRHAKLRKALFKYLWKQRHEQEPCYIANILEQGLKEFPRPNDPKPRTKEEKSEHAKKQYDRVCALCSDLSKALKEYFGKHTKGWIISLPVGSPQDGYQLAIIKYNSVTRAFWDAHLSHPTRIRLVYTEQLFFQDWQKHAIFRDFLLNDEKGDEEALSQLAARCPQIIREYPHMEVTHPYVASGEIAARDMIVEWFRDHAFRKVETAISRKFVTNQVAVKESLILLRSRVTNRLVEETLSGTHANGLCISHYQVPKKNRVLERVTINGCSDEAEKLRLAPYNPRFTGEHADFCTLDYDPEKSEYALVILTRTHSPYNAIKTPVTIISSHRGWPVAFVAELLTDEDRMEKLKAKYHWPDILPRTFQVLFEVPAVRRDKVNGTPRLTPLAWRPLLAQSISK